LLCDPVDRTSDSSGTGTTAAPVIALRAASTAGVGLSVPSDRVGPAARVSVALDSSVRVDPGVGVAGADRGGGRGVATYVRRSWPC